MRAALVVATVLLLGSGCMPRDDDPARDGGPGAVGGCTTDDDCGTSVSAGCEKAPGETFGVCIHRDCVRDEDCRFGYLCEVRSMLCYPPAECAPGFDERCGDGELCAMGDRTASCVARDELRPAVSCISTPSIVHLRPGEAAMAELTAVDDEGQPVPHGTCEVSVVTESCDTAPYCAVTTSSECAGAPCTTTVRHYPPLEQGQVRVVVVDEHGLTVLGARVVVRAEGALLESTTGLDGIVRLEGVGLVEAVSAFADGREWHTVLGDPRDIVIAALPVVTETHSGVAVGSIAFSYVDTMGDIRLGVMGLSIAEPTELSSSALLGPDVQRTVVLEGVTDADGVLIPIPNAVVVELADEPLKTSAIVEARPGGRIPWALGGKVRLSEVGDLFNTLFLDEEFDPTLPLAHLAAFQAPGHAVTAPRDIPEVLRAADYADATANGAASLDELRPGAQDDVELVVHVPALPCTATSLECGAGDRDSVIALVGAWMPPYGLVPLGLGAGVDDPFDTGADGDLDGNVTSVPLDDGALPASGELHLSPIPPHDGLEGAVVVVALFSHGPTVAGTAGTTALLRHGRTLPTTIEFAREHLRYPRAAVDGSVITVDPEPTADFHRIDLHDADGHWRVWLPSGVTSVDLASLRPSDVVGRDAAAAITAFDVDDEDLDLLRAWSWRRVRAWSTIGCGDGSSCAVAAAGP